MSIGIGDVVRTRAGHVRQVTSVSDYGRTRSYALMPLVGSPGRRSHAESVRLVRTFELTFTLRHLDDAVRRARQDAPELARAALHDARLWLVKARERGQDSAGELESASRHVATVAARLERGEPSS